MNLSKPPYLPRIWWNPDYIKEQEEKDKERHPFANRDEASDSGFNLLDGKGHPNTLIFRVKGDADTEEEVMITGVSDTGLSFSGASYSYQYLFEQYEWFDGERWVPFGTFKKENEKERKEEERNGVAEFQVGHKYVLEGDECFVVLNKFTSPKDGETYIVIDRAGIVESHFVFKRPVCSEFIWFMPKIGKGYRVFATNEIIKGE